jgi:hypothetical protein
VNLYQKLLVSVKLIQAVMADDYQNQLFDPIEYIFDLKTVHYPLFISPHYKVAIGQK